MRNTLLLLSLCFIYIASFGQSNTLTDSSAVNISSPSDLKVTTTLTMRLDSQGFVSVTIPQTVQRQVQKDWIEYAGRGSKGKSTVVNGDNIQYGAVNKNISPSQFDISCRLLGTNDGVRVTVWLTENNSLLVSREQNSDRTIALQKYVHDFAVVEYRQAVLNELKAEQAKQKIMENELTKQIKEDEKAGKRIEGDKASILHTKDAITTSNNDIQSVTAKIESQKVMVDNNAADPNASKGAKKTLRQLEDQKKDLQKLNDKRGKEIMSWSNDIRADERVIADDKEKEAAKRANIEKQKQTIQAVQAKLDEIK